ncbi:SCF E3 ubiquitin ligase complex F-box protein [Nymphaea thermarum]|nr:SCF E3 ubiquitin ligase complex F-box protein [Nymphaea thermarum]
MLQAASSCFSKKKSGLTSLSLKGAYQLTDVGLLAVVSAAPALSSVNLSDCSSLTEAGIYELADKLTTSLKELYIDGCQQLDAMAMLHSLLKLRNLEVLSVAGIQSVSDAFISSLVSVHGPKMKGLVLADCGNLTDSSIKAVAAQCSGLSTLSLNNLHNLTDAAIRCLADGCRSIEVLTVNRCSFRF